MVASIVKWVPGVSTRTTDRAWLRQTDSREGRPCARPAGENSVSWPRYKPGRYRADAISALAATRMPLDGAAPREERHARKPSAALRSAAGHVRNGHRTGLIIVSNSPTRPTSSPASDKRRAISNATSPPEE